MSDAQIALSAAESAAASASSAATSATGLAESVADAVAAKNAAETAKTGAETARDTAEDFALGFGPGTATTIAPGATPTLDITGPAGAKVLDLGIPAAEVDDASLTALDANAASAFRVQSDARLAATIGTELKPVQAGGATDSTAIITFIDDDANPLWYDIWGVIAAEKGIEVSLAAVMGSATGEDATAVAAYPSMTIAQLKAIEAAGHDILCHGWQHLPSYTGGGATDAQIETDWGLASAAMRQHFPTTADIMVYPGGLAKTELTRKAIARKYFRYGIAASGSYMTGPVDNWTVERINLDTASEATAKGAIDGAKARNAWLIFMNHDKEMDTTGGGRAAQMTKVRNVIDYAVAQSVPIMKFTDAEKIKGNAVAIGEATQPGATFISRSGSRKWGDAMGKWTPTLYGTTTPGAHVYASQKGFYQQVGGMAVLKGYIQIAAGTAASVTGTTDAVNIGTAGNLVLSINGAANVTVALAAADTPASVVTKINTAIGAAGTASLVASKLKIASAAVGPATTVQVVSGTGTVLTDLGFTAGQAGAGGGGLDSLMAGNLRIGGLPSTVAGMKMSTADIGAFFPLEWNFFNLGANYTKALGRVSAGGTNPDFITLLKDGNNVAEAFLARADMSLTQTVIIGFTAMYLSNAYDAVWQ